MGRVAWLLSGILIASGCNSKVARDAGPDPIDTGAGLGFCPTHLEFELIASESRSDPGSSGGAHGTGLPGGSFYALETYDCDEDCRRCRTRGPVRIDRAVVSQRCLNQYETTCELDADCPNVGTDPKAVCRFMFPPISFNAFGSFSSCSLAYYEPVAEGQPIEGVYDLKTGEASFERNNLILTTSIGAICPSCINDSSPNDGLKGGSCDDGATIGAECDIHGVSNTAIPFLTSFDCRPSAAFSLDTRIPARALTTASIHWEHDASRPNCTGSGFEALKCLCGVCENSQTACFRDTQCAAPSTCGWPGDMNEIVTQPNSCKENVGPCDWDVASQTGTCDGALGPGTSCFPAADDPRDDLIIKGDAQVREGFYISTFAGLLCLPPFGNPLIDALVGFPGPALLRLAYRVTPRDL